MGEHVDLLKRELRQLSANLERARHKPGVRQEELENLLQKIRLKTDLLHLLEKQLDGQDCAVFWIMPPSEFTPNPEFVQFGNWHSDISAAEEELEWVRKNPRCAHAKIVIRTVLFTDYEVQKHD